MGMGYKSESVCPREFVENDCEESAEVDRAMSALRYQKVALGDAVSELRERLFPVLRDVPGVSNGEAYGPAESPLATEIYAEASGVEDSLSEIRSILSRLAV